MNRETLHLKPLSREGIPAALDKAMRYRLLNEPGEAESICHDVLRVDARNQQALATLLLALTDRFGKGYSVGMTQIQEVLPLLNDPYERAYYAGIICERRAKALLHHAASGSAFEAYAFLREAMTHYEQAERIRPAGNDDALLRWNACVRIITGNRLSPRPEDRVEFQLE
ncbi:MAG: hypothetical protein ACR2OZ_12360 [Verrucomicrobiales bacterium]